MFVVIRLLYKSFRLSTTLFKMLIKNFKNIFWLIKNIYNIVLGNLFPGTY